MGVLVLASFVACADAAPRVYDIPALDQLGQAQEICEVVVRVQPDDGHFDGCVSSVEGSLENASREHAIVRARDACFTEGLKPGSSDLALCLLHAADATSDATDPPNQLNLMSGGKNERAPSANDSSASFDSATQRAQRACAEIGFDPAFGAFENCVTDLQSTLQKTDFSAN